MNICNINDEKCYFCHLEVETLEHLLWDCPEVQKLWLNIVKILDPYLNLSEVLNCKSVLGIRTGQDVILVNHIINIIKNYIYVTKWTDKKLTLSGALAKVRSVFCIEQNASVQYNKETSFSINKWRPVCNFFSALNNK